MVKNVDIIIVGAGIPGLVLAHYLTPHFKILILDRAAPPLPPGNPLEHRVSSINTQSVGIFETLGLWPQIPVEKRKPVKEMQVLDGLNQTELTFNEIDSGQEALSYIIENNLLIQLLLDGLTNCKNCEIIRPVNLSALSIESNLAYIETTEGDQYQAKLVVGADGAQSWLRSQANIDLQEKDYEQQALIATLKIEKPHQDTAFQVFLPTGPLAFLPLPDPHTVSIVWSSSEDLFNLSEEDFIQALLDKVNKRYGKIELLSKRQIFPLKMRHTKKYVKERLALMGDAAHTIHPLAGQGLNLGIADAACLATIILKAHSQNRNYYSEHNLKKYQRIRKAENSKMIYAMSAFHHLFRNTHKGIVKARSLGLSCVNKSNLLKRLFVHLAN
jgi:2-octaprenylphenol hydroxylase